MASNRLSFAARLSLISTGLVALCALVISIVYHRAYTSRTIETHSTELSATAKTLAIVIGSEWEQYEPVDSNLNIQAILDRLVDSIPILEHSTEVRIWKRTENGTSVILARSSHLDEGRGSWDPNSPIHVSQPVQRSTCLADIKNGRGQSVAYIEIESDSALFRGQTNLAYIWQLGIALSTVTVIGLIAYFFSRRFTNPIKELIDATREIAEGNLNHRLNVDPTNEFGSVFHAFNKMTEELKRARVRRTENEEQLIEFQNELIESRDKAELGTKAKSDFLAKMTHEIRTPINGIVGLTDILKDRTQDSEQLKLLESISNSGEALLNIANDVLDLSKVEAGKMELHETPFDLKEFVRDLSIFYKPLAHKKGIEMKSFIQDRIPYYVTCDGFRLRQVLTNLLNNAIKFTKDGYLSLDTRVLTLKDTEATIKFSVRDTGIGIDENGKKRLFKAFSQADSSTSRNFGGTGLGLVISESIIEKMGSKIGLESKPGKGSCFSFVLTLQIPDQKAIDKENQEKGKGNEFKNSLAGFRALIADDSHVNQLTITYQMRNLGCDFDIVSDGQEAVDAVKKSSYDFILMDVSMPGMDGLQATKEIRKFETEAKRYTTPIIALTANAFNEQKEECIQAGMDDFLTKPFRAELLVDKATVWVARSAGKLNGKIEVSSKSKPRKKKDIPQSNSDVANDQAPESITNYAFLDLLPDTYGKDVSKEIMIEFLKEGQLTYLELLEAFQNEDRSKISRAAHKLRGDVKILGYESLATTLTHIQHSEEKKETQIKLEQRIEELEHNYGALRLELLNRVQPR